MRPNRLIYSCHNIFNPGRLGIQFIERILNGLKNAVPEIYEPRWRASATGQEKAANERVKLGKKGSLSQGAQRSQSFIQRTPYGTTPFIQDMSIDHGGSYILVPKQLLHCSNVISVPKQFRREAMPESMAVDNFVNASQSPGFFYGLIETAFVNVVTPSYSASWIK